MSFYQFLDRVVLSRLWSFSEVGFSGGAIWKSGKCQRTLNFLFFKFILMSIVSLESIVLFVPHCLTSCCIADLCATVVMNSTNQTNTETYLTIWSPSKSLTGVQTVTVMSGCLVEGGGVESSPDIKVTIHQQPFLFSCSQGSTLKSSFNSTCITTSRGVVIRAKIRVFFTTPTQIKAE